MNREALEQYKDLCLEIKRIKNRISKLESKIEHDKVSGSNVEFPYQPITIKIEGLPSNEILELREILKEREEKAKIQKLEIEKFIAKIGDCRTRMIFEMKHIEGKTWLQISREFRSKHESYARKIHDRYLKEVEE